MFAPVEELESMYRRAASLTGNSKAEDNEKRGSELFSAAQETKGTQKGGGFPLNN